MQKPRILFCVESLSCGGAEKSLLSLLNSMDQNKFEIDVLVYKPGGEFEKFLPKTMNLKSIGFTPGISHRINFKLLRFLNLKNRHHNAQLLWKSIRTAIPSYKTNYDIAVSWGQGFATYYVSQKVKAAKKYAWVNIDYEKAGYYWKQDVHIYKEFDRVVGVSEFVKESMQKFLPKKQVISIRNIIDPDEIKSRGKEPKPENFEENSINIVSVGRLAKQKGFELAIGAIKKLIDDNLRVHLYIVGEGPERTTLEKGIEDLQLENHITLLGFRDNPYPYINDCDIYLQSSWFEGLGRTIIEAGLLCKPIVTTDFPTAYSILKDKETGLIVPMTVEDIALGIKEIIEDVSLKNRLVSNLEKQEDKEKEKTLKAVYSLFES